MGNAGSNPVANDGGAMRARTAQYIEEMTAELSAMAARSDLPVLSYLLDLARIEAGLTTRGASDQGAAERVRIGG